MNFRVKVWAALGTAVVVLMITLPLTGCAGNLDGYVHARTEIMQPV